MVEACFEGKLMKLLLDSSLWYVRGKLCRSGTRIVKLTSVNFLRIWSSLWMDVMFCCLFFPFAYIYSGCTLGNSNELINSQNWLERNLIHWVRRIHVCIFLSQVDSVLNLVSTLVCDQEDQPSEQVSTSLLRTSHVNNAVS